MADKFPIFRDIMNNFQSKTTLDIQLKNPNKTNDNCSIDHQSWCVIKTIWLSTQNADGIVRCRNCGWQIAKDKSDRSNKKCHSPHIYDLKHDSNSQQLMSHWNIRNIKSNRQEFVDTFSLNSNKSMCQRMKTIGWQWR